MKAAWANRKEGLSILEHPAVQSISVGKLGNSALLKFPTTPDSGRARGRNKMPNILFMMMCGAEVISQSFLLARLDLDGPGTGPPLHMHGAWHFYGCGNKRHYCVC